MFSLLVSWFTILTYNFCIFFLLKLVSKLVSNGRSAKAVSCSKDGDLAKGQMHTTESIRIPPFNKAQKLSLDSEWQTCILQVLQMAVQPKMSILSLFTHVFPNLYEFSEIFWGMWIAGPHWLHSVFFHTNCLLTHILLKYVLLCWTEERISYSFFIQVSTIYGLNYPFNVAEYATMLFPSFRQQICHWSGGILRVASHWNCIYNC